MKKSEKNRKVIENLIAREWERALLGQITQDTFFKRFNFFIKTSFTWWERVTASRLVKRIEYLESEIPKRVKSKVVIWNRFK